MRNSKQYVKAALGALACVGIVACGGGNSPTAPTQVATPPPAPVTTVVSQGALSSLEPNSGVTLPFTTTGIGKLDVAVDWTFASCDVDVFVLRGTACSPAQFNAGQCDFVAYSASVTAKPEKVSVASLAPGTYALLIINWGPATESISYQALLTTGAATPASRTPEAAPNSKFGVTRILSQN